MRREKIQPAPGRSDQPRRSISKSASYSCNTMQTTIGPVECPYPSDRLRAAEEEAA
jgi:hypothetical protein